MSVVQSKNSSELELLGYTRWIIIRSPIQNLTTYDPHSSLNAVSVVSASITFSNERTL